MEECEPIHIPHQSDGSQKAKGEKVSQDEEWTIAYRHPRIIRVGKGPEAGDRPFRDGRRWRANAFEVSPGLQVDQSADE